MSSVRYVEPKTADGSTSANAATVLRLSDGPPAASRLARLYVLCDATRRRVASWMDAVWCGFWLGVFDRKGLHGLDAQYYTSNDLYTSEQHNRRGLFPWEHEALTHHFPASGSLLVVGAGGGREVLALALRGYAAQGYECHPALVEGAARLLADSGVPSRVRLLERDRAPDVAPPCDGAIVGWSTYTLIAGRDHRIAFLRGIRRCVAAGAPVLISFFSRSGRERRLPVVRAIAAAVRTLRRAERPELGDDLAPNFVHRFTIAEIVAELGAAGFALEAHVPQGSGRFESGYAVGRALGEPAPASARDIPT